MQSRLEMKLEEGRTVREVRMRLEQENMRLQHRGAYLEETVGDLQGAMDRARQSLVVLDMVPILFGMVLLALKDTDVEKEESKAATQSLHKLYGA